MSFGTTPVSTTTLGTNQFPVSAVAVPGEPGGALTALEGGPESTDGNGNKTAPASIYTKDGGNITLGSMADGASTDATQTNKSAMSFFKGWVKILNDVWDSTNHLFHQNVKQIGGTAVSVNAGNRDVGTQRYIEAGNPTPTVTQVASSVSDVSILAANANKKGTLFFNDSTQILYLIYGTGTASPTNYSVQISPKAYFEDPLHYTGGFHGIWAAANGFVYCTEVS